MQHLKPFYILWSTFTYIIFLFFNKMSLKYFVWLGQVLAVACMMQFSSHGSNSGSLHWKRGISTTGLQGKSHINFSYHPCSCCYCWVTKSCLTLRTHGLQHTRLSCLSLSPRVCSNSCPLSHWCHPTVSSSVTRFSSCPQSFPALGSFPASWLFASDGQSIGVSVSVPLIDIQGWFPLVSTGWISLQSKGLPRVFSNTSVQKH